MLFVKAGPVYKIESERLVLSCWEPRFARLFKQAIDSSIDHLLPWMPWAIHEPQTLEAKMQRLQKMRDDFAAGRDYVYGIFSPAMDEVYGSSGLHERVGAFGTEIGYWISKSRIGQGLASEAARCLTKVAFETGDIDRVEIHCDRENQPSARVAAKLGFTHEATLRRRSKDAQGNFHDSMVWTLFRDDYERSPLAQHPLTCYAEDGSRMAL